MDYNLMNNLITNVENSIKEIKKATNNKDINKIHNEVYALKISITSMEDLINNFK